MSFNRDKTSDRRETERVMQLKRHVFEPDNVRMNWLGHRFTSGTAQIDLGLLKGMTRDQLESYRGAVGVHLHHLKTEHGLDITQVDGVYRFAEAQLRKKGASNT